MAYEGANMPLLGKCSFVKSFLNYAYDIGELLAEGNSLWVCYGGISHLSKDCFEALLEVPHASLRCLWYESCIAMNDKVLCLSLAWALEKVG